MLTVAVGSDDVDALQREVPSALAKLDGVVADRPGPRTLVHTMKPGHTELQAWFWIDIGHADELEVLDGAM